MSLAEDAASDVQLLSNELVTTFTAEGWEAVDWIEKSSEWSTVLSSDANTCTITISYAEADEVAVLEGDN